METFIRYIVTYYEPYIYIYILILRDDFKIHFVDLDNVHVPEWLVALSDMKIDNEFY